MLTDILGVNFHSIFLKTVILMLIFTVMNFGLDSVHCP